MRGRLVVGLRAAALLAGLGAVVLPAAATAQVQTREDISLQNQILELRNELETLRAQIPAGGSVISPYPAAPAERVAPAGELSTQMLTRLSTLEEQVRGLTGRVDELANQVRRQGDQLSKQIGDLNYRLQTVEGGGRAAGRAMAVPPGGEPTAARAAEPTAMSPAPSTLGSLPLLPPREPQPQAAAPPPYYTPSTTDTGGLPLLPPPEPQSGAPAAAGPLPLLPPPEPRTAPPRRAGSAQAMAGPMPMLPPRSETEAAARPTGPRTPDAALRDGEAALGRRDYGTAEAAAREVLSSGSASRAADAQFLLGESLAGARNYPQAAVAYDDAYRRAPTGPHAQEALLGMAGALAGVGARPAACAALDKLRAEFLTQRAAVRDAAANLRQRAACRS